ncbi:MAG: hypothetical protein ACRCZ0_11610 [Cetobacterium sp.]
MKKILLLALAISTLSYSAPKTSYKTGVAFALKDYFDTPAVKVIEVNDVVQLEENVFAQRVKYKTYNDFGGEVVEEGIFILKKIDNKYSFMEKLSKEDIEL